MSPFSNRRVASASSASFSLHGKAYVHRGGQDQVAFLHRAVARLPVGFGQAHRTHGIGMGLGIARTEYAFEDFERPVRLSLLHELESPLGLPVRGTDGQQRQQRITAAADLPLYSSDSWLSLVYFIRFS